MKRTLWAAAALCGALGLPAPARANDHNDGAVIRLRPTDGDITGFYGWMAPDRGKLNLALAWAPDSTPATRFSDAVQWVFRVASRPEARGADARELVVLCTFDVAQRVSCWAGDEHVSGDASGKAGLASASGRLRVFAGLRNDPFFFNLAGFRSAGARLSAAAAGAPKDAAGCPALDAGVRADLSQRLRSGADGGAPRDDFARQNVLALVVQLDAALATTGGRYLALSASTHKRP